MDVPFLCDTVRRRPGLISVAAVADEVVAVVALFCCSCFVAPVVVVVDGDDVDGVILSLLLGKARQVVCIPAVAFAAVIVSNVHTQHVVVRAAKTLSLVRFLRSTLNLCKSGSGSQVRKSALGRLLKPLFNLDDIEFPTESLLTPLKEGSTEVKSEISVL